MTLLSSCKMTGLCFQVCDVAMTFREAHWTRGLPGRWPSQQSSKSPTWKIENAKNNNNKKEAIQVILLTSMLHYSKMVTLAPEDRQTIANFCSGLATLQEEPRNMHDFATINIPYFSFMYFLNKSTCLLDMRRTYKQATPRSPSCQKNL